MCFQLLVAARQVRKLLFKSRLLVQEPGEPERVDRSSDDHSDRWPGGARCGSMNVARVDPGTKRSDHGVPQVVHTNTGLRVY